MSGKLDQSLDQIMQDTKPAGGRGRRPRVAGQRRAAAKAKAAIAAPTGGIQKNRVNAKGTKGAAPAIAAPPAGDSKIIVSNLPEDVTETQIKDYFGKTIGHIRRVLLTYGPTGRSRGVATIIFSDSTAGAKAAKQLDGVKVDNKAMKVEVVIGAKQAPAPAAPKTLADRMSQPKAASKQKEKTETGKTGKKANAAATTNGAGKTDKNARGKKAGRAGRPKKKTADELDADMMDYFGGGEGAVTNGTAQPAAAANGADAGMVDEVL